MSRHVPHGSRRRPAAPSHAPPNAVTWRRAVYSSALPPAAKLTVVALGDYMDWTSGRGVHGRPGMDRLSEDFGLQTKPDTLRKHLSDAAHLAPHPAAAAGARRRPTPPADPERDRHGQRVIDGTCLYRSAWEALVAAAKAAGAEVCGSNRVHPSNPRMDGRWGSGLWVADDGHAERMAAGLRLTGFDVVVLPGYSTGVVIRDAAPADGSSRQG